LRGRKWTALCKKQFEKWLLEWEPALGGINHQGAHQTVPNALPVYYLEPEVHAIHEEARETLLPYDTYKDSENWNTAPIVLQTKADVFYINHVLRCLHVAVSNGNHRQYPKIWYGHYWDVDDKVNELVPEELMCHFQKPTRPRNSSAPPYKYGDPDFIHGVAKKKNRNYNYHCVRPSVTSNTKSSN